MIDRSGISAGSELLIGFDSMPNKVSLRLRDYFESLEIMEIADFEKQIEDILRRSIENCAFIIDFNISRRSFDTALPCHIQAIAKATNGATIEFWVHCSREQPQIWQNVSVERGYDPDTIRIWVMAMYEVSAMDAEKCESYGWAWVDLEGNLRIYVSPESMLAAGIGLTLPRLHG